MYYRAGGDMSREYTALAESVNCINWTRPSLGLFEFNGSKDNNIIWTGKEAGYWESHNFTPFKDKNPKCDPSQKYKAVTLGRRDVDGDGENERVLLGFASGDGIHWFPIQDDAIISEGGGFDSQNVAFWDTNLEKYVCYSRVGVNGIRGIQRSLSGDFLKWSKPELLEYGDAKLEQFYTNAIIQYFRAPHIYLGFPMRFVPERKSVSADNKEVDALSDAVFMSSRDGIHWDRYFMEAFIRPGLNQQNWGNGHGNQMAAWGLVPTSPEEISIFWNENYDYNNKTGHGPSLIRGILRTDGFVSVNAPFKGGRFVTKPLVFKGKSLYINFSTSAVGYIKVEITDPDAKPFKGFDINSSEELYGDEIERIVKWNNKSDVSSLNGKIVKLKFNMKDADLYSIQFR